MQTNQTDKATARPWVSHEMADGFNIRPENGTDADNRSRIKLCMAYLPKIKFDGAGATIEQAGGSEDEQRANAELIVQAVNEHAAYQETVRALLAVLPYGNEALQIKAEKLLRGEL